MQQTKAKPQRQRPGVVAFTVNVNPATFAAIEAEAERRGVKWRQIAQEAIREKFATSEAA
jgi:hypothetical protein